MSENAVPIEDEILRTLLMLNSKEEVGADQRVKMKAIQEEIDAMSETDIETDIDADEAVKQDLAPVSQLQFLLKPVLSEAILELLAKLLNSDPEAHKALVKLLTATNTPAVLRKALTSALAQCMERGYANAENVLREAYSKSKEPVHFIALVRAASSFSADSLELKQRPSIFPPIPKPR